MLNTARGGGDWGGGCDNLGMGGGGGRGGASIGFDFGPENNGAGARGRGRGAPLPVDVGFDFGSENNGAGARGRGRGAPPPMDTGFDFGENVGSVGRGGRGRGAPPSMDAGLDFGPENNGASARGRGRGAPPPMDPGYDFGENVGSSGRGGRGRGAPQPMDAGFDFVENVGSSGRGGRGRGAPPPMDAGLDFGPENNGASARGRGRGAPPPMDAGFDFGENVGSVGRGRGRGAPPPMDAGFGFGLENNGVGARGRGRGVPPPMDAEFKFYERDDQPDDSFVPKTRTIEEIRAEDARFKEKYNTIREEDENVTVTGPHADKYQAIERWADFDFEPALLINIQKSNYTVPRKIQSLSFPLIKAGHDLKGHAETGSGKSAAFLLPIIDAIMKLKKAGQYKSKRCCPFALILEPTRELASQVYDQARKLAVDCDVSVSRAYGKFIRNVNMRQISTDGCDILVGTPGRICDFFHSKNVNCQLLCDNLKVLVFDEADHLLEDGFQVTLRQLNNVKNWPKAEDRQTLLFSATFPLVVQNWADEWMRQDSMMVSNKRLVAANSRVKQRFLMVSGTSKKDTLLRLFQLELQTAKKRDPTNGKIRNTMVFVNTKRDADVVSSYLNQFGFNTTTINGNRPQEMREQALSDFRAGLFQVVVTTDVCARGHDLKDLDHVINLDLPASGEGIDDSFTTYVHRIGRTGRLQQGSATTFFDIDADATMAEGFINSLREAGQSVPDWLNKLAACEPVIGSSQVTDEELLCIL